MSPRPPGCPTNVIEIPLLGARLRRVHRPPSRRFCYHPAFVRLNSIRLQGQWNVRSSCHPGRCHLQPWSGSPPRLAIARIAFPLRESASFRRGQKLRPPPQFDSEQRRDSGCPKNAGRGSRYLRPDAIGARDLLTAHDRHLRGRQEKPIPSPITDRVGDSLIWLLSHAMPVERQEVLLLCLDVRKAVRVHPLHQRVGLLRDHVQFRKELERGLLPGEQRDLLLDQLDRGPSH